MAAPKHLGAPAPHATARHCTRCMPLLQILTHARTRLALAIVLARREVVLSDQATAYVACKDK